MIATIAELAAIVAIIWKPGLSGQINQSGSFFAECTFLR